MDKDVIFTSNKINILKFLFKEYPKYNYCHFFQNGIASKFSKFSHDNKKIIMTKCVQSQKMIFVGIYKKNDYV